MFDKTKKGFVKTITNLAFFSFLLVMCFSFNSLDTNAQNVSATLTLNQGTLAIDTSTTTCALSGTVSSTNSNVSCTLSGITVTDTRGSGVGWSATYNVRNFSSGSNVITLCSDTICTVKRLSSTWSAISAVSGNTFGVTDVTGLQQPTSITGTTANDTTNTLSLMSFSNANQTYGQVTVTNGGSGYTLAPGITFTGGSCTQSPTATSTIASGKVTAINVTQPGLGCTSAPTVGFTGGGGGTGASATMVAGSGEGQYTKATSANGFVLSIPAFVRSGSYSSVISISVA